MSIKVNILLLEIPHVRPYGWNPRLYNGVATVQGHEFDLMVELEFRKKFSLFDSLDFDETALNWNERIRWYAPDPYPAAGPLPGSYTDTYGRQPGLKWKFQREDVVDFAAADRRDTVKTVKIGWFGMGFDPGWWKPWEQRKWRDVIEQLEPGMCPVNYDAIAKKEKTDPKKWLAQKLAVAKYFQSHGQTLKTVLTDRPGLTKQAGSDDGGWSATGGGGFLTLNRFTRRRVVHFNLGITKLGKMATATQVLETVGGTPTINKFLVPGCTLLESESPNLLARWRTELDTANVDNFSLGK
jgi:hypothetical protein